jgi:hypothetical protein
MHDASAELLQHDAFLAYKRRVRADLDALETVMLDPINLFAHLKPTYQ